MFLFGPDRPDGVETLAAATSRSEQNVPNDAVVENASIETVPQLIVRPSICRRVARPPRDYKTAWTSVERGMGFQSVSVHLS